jgi:hypothetical protein
LRRKRYYDDGAISEMVLWHLPEPVPGSSHGFRYRLFYGYPGRRTVCYDNERGKGDRRHHLGVEEPCRLETLDKSVADFEADVAALRTREDEDE